MEDRSGQGGVDADVEDIFEILHRAGTAGSDDGHRQFRRQAAVQFQVEAGLFAVGIHGVHADFTGTEGDALFSPGDGVDARILAAPFDVDLPAAVVVALGVDGQDNALAAETLGRFADQFGTADSGRVDRYLVSTGPQDLVEVVDAANAAANGKGNGNGLGYGADDVDEDMAFFMGRRNIVEDEFVGELVGIEFPQFDRVVDVLDVFKLLAFDDAAIADVQARYNTFCQHLTFPLRHGFRPW